MNLFRVLLMLLFAGSLSYAAPPLQSDALFYKDDDTQVTSEIEVYQTIVQDVPIKGSVLITHDSTKKVDVDSFRIGDKPLKVTFVTSQPMGDSLEVSVYSFELEGMKNGQHVLPPVVVKIGGNEYQAPSMVVDVGPGAQ